MLCFACFLFCLLRNFPSRILKVTNFKFFLTNTNLRSLANLATDQRKFIADVQHQLSSRNANFSKMNSVWAFHTALHLAPHSPV